MCCCFFLSNWISPGVLFNNIVSWAMQCAACTYSNIVDVDKISRSIF